MKGTTVVKTFGGLILAQRTKLKLTFRQLETRTGLAATYICELQNKHHRPSFETVLRLKQVLRLTWEEIESCKWDGKRGPR